MENIEEGNISMLASAIKADEFTDYNTVLSDKLSSSEKIKKKFKEFIERLKGLKNEIEEKKKDIEEQISNKRNYYSKRKNAWKFVKKTAAVVGSALAMAFAFGTNTALLFGGLALGALGITGYKGPEEYTEGRADMPESGMFNKTGGTIRPVSTDNWLNTTPSFNSYRANTSEPTFSNDKNPTTTQNHYEEPLPYEHFNTNNTIPYRSKIPEPIKQPNTLMDTNKFSNEMSDYEMRNLTFDNYYNSEPMWSNLNDAFNNGYFTDNFGLPTGKKVDLNGNIKNCFGMPTGDYIDSTGNIKDTFSMPTGYYIDNSGQIMDEFSMSSGYNCKYD